MGEEVRRRVPSGKVAAATRALGKLIREERRKLGWSQEVLAAAAGVSQPAVSYLECGTYYPKVETIERIASALGWRWEEFVAEARRRQETVTA